MNVERRTIVGGRSRSDRLVGDFPRGIEILLKKARVDSTFRELVLQDPLTAGQSIALDLKPLEINILNSTPRSVLQKMIDNTRVPKQHVKTFRTARTAAVLALVLSSTVVMPTLASAGIEESPSQGIEQVELAKERMTAVQEALEAFRKEHGRYPETKEWFEIPNPLAEYIPTSVFYDPWKRRFHYKAVKEGGKIVNYTLESLGLDVESLHDNIPCPIATDEHRFTGVSPIKILFPLEGYTITINGKPGGSDGAVQFQAEHENEKVLVDWYLNGVIVGSTVKTHNLKLELGLGKHILLLVYENEDSAIIHFSVAEQEASR